MTNSAINPSIAAILGMAVVTYATRAAGLWIMGRMNLSRRMEAWLTYIPGAILVSIVVPAVVRGGVKEGVAALITAGVAWKTRSLPVAMVVGVACIWALRSGLLGA